VQAGGETTSAKQHADPCHGDHLLESNPEIKITSLILSQTTQAAIFLVYFIITPCQVEDDK
jgi:hypothetical protein